MKLLNRILFGLLFGLFLRSPLRADIEIDLGPANSGDQTESSVDDESEQSAEDQTEQSADDQDDLATPTPGSASTSLSEGPLNFKTKFEHYHFYLSWDPVKGAKGYNVYMSRYANNYLLINRKPISSNYYSISCQEIDKNHPYYFAVTFVDMKGRESKRAYAEIKMRQE